MSKYENQSKNNTRRIYIRSQRRWQEVPEEIYQEHTRFHDTYRHRMQDRGLCCCPRNKLWVCDADCLTCEYRNADVSLILPNTTYMHSLRNTDMHQQLFCLSAIS